MVMPSLLKVLDYRELRCFVINSYNVKTYLKARLNRMRPDTPRNAPTQSTAPPIPSPMV